MRIDKFLKDSRLIKRRTLAKEACDAGKIEINNKVAKAGDNVKENDIININFSNYKTIVEVISDGDGLRNPKPEELYRLVDRIKQTD